MKLQTQVSCDTKPDFPQGNNGKPGCEQRLEKAIRKLSENYLLVRLSQAAISSASCLPWPLPPAVQLPELREAGDRPTFLVCL